MGGGKERGAWTRVREGGRGVTKRLRSLGGGTGATSRRVVSQEIDRATDRDNMEKEKRGTGRPAEEVWTKTSRNREKHHKHMGSPKHNKKYESFGKCKEKKSKIQFRNDKYSTRDSIRIL